MAAVGVRIIVDGHYGTVKFVGVVPGTEGEWLGVDWDDPKRGKHDGTKDAVRYFTTSHPTSGSFLRPKKADFGKDFLSAVKERYGIIEDDNAGVIVEDMYVCGKGQKTTVEVVGAKSVNLHQGQFNQLQEIALRGLPVSSAGTAGDIRASMPMVKELDVSDTLMPSWSVLATITQQLPMLEILNVSDNRLEFNDEDFDEMKDAFAKVKVLTANRCRMTWGDVRQLSRILPSVETMHVCFNDITDLTVEENEFRKLKFVNLEGNTIGKWDEVLHLSSLQSLQTLILNNTGIEEIEFSDITDGKTKHLPKLKALSIFHNKISDWSSVNEMNKLPSFEDLKFRFNPLTEDTKLNEDMVRIITIAKIASLQVLNRTRISEEERQDAELYYLRKFGKEWREAGGHQDPSKNKPSKEFLHNHPRYLAGIEAYGAFEDSELVVKTSALKNNLISVNIVSPLVPEKEPIEKKLPVAMTVQKLKTLVQRIYKGHASTLTLYYMPAKYPDKEFELDNDLRDLGYFAIEDGDTIVVKWH